MAEFNQMQREMATLVAKTEGTKSIEDTKNGEK